MNKTVSINMHKLSAMPWIQLFASPACNLKCAYCSQQAVRTHRVTRDFLQDPELLEFITRIPPTHFYLSGGEPLIHSGVKEFIALAGRNGHKTSIDTNLHISKKRLEDYLSCWNPDWLGFINISHHLVCNIGMDVIESRVVQLEEAGIGHFVKYVGVPDHLALIERNMKYLKDRGTGAMVSIMQGNWNGRMLPAEYSLDETLKLLNLVTLNTHGLQVFEGIHSKRIPCRGGQDFIAYNMHDDHKIIPCCHGSSSPLNMCDTYFETGDSRQSECKLETCMADMVFICGINGVTDEIERLEKICCGNSEFQGVESVMKFTEEIAAKGYRIVNNNKFQDVQKHLSGSRHSYAVAGINNIHEGRTRYGAELITEIEQFISRWEDPEDAIRDNPSMESEMRGELSRVPSADKKVLARALGKKAAQHHYGLPIKCNFEVISTCILKCEFCTLHEDLRKYRRKTRMTYGDFMKIWRYMEVFTTEVEFIGGEPLLNKEVFDMIRETNKTGVYSTLTTNAQLLDKELCESILDSKPSRVLIAFDSVGAENYESIRLRGKFERLKDNIIHLSHRKREMGIKRPEINIQMVVSKKNKHEIDQFWREAVEMEVDSASIKPILVWPGSGPEFEKMMIDKYLIPGHQISYHQIDADGELVKSRKPGFCSNTQTVHIGSGSEVIPCWYILKDTYIAGYAADSPFTELWFSEEYKDYRRRMKDDTVSDGCPGCIGKYEPSMFKTKAVSEIKEEMVIDEISNKMNLRAEQKFREGKIHEAKSILFDLIKKYPDQSRALNNLGVIYLQDGYMENAVECFEMSLKAYPENGDALINYAAVLASSGDKQKADIYYKKYLQTKTGNDEEGVELFSEIEATINNGSKTPYPEEGPS